MADSTGAYVSDWLACPGECGYAEFSGEVVVHLRRHHDLEPEQAEQVVRDLLTARADDVPQDCWPSHDR